MKLAFTIIELLVTIAITALLLSLVLTALLRGREHAQDAVSLANLRTHAQIFTIYSNDFRGVAPYFTKIGAFSTTLIGGGVIEPKLSYFDANRTWHIALADKYYSRIASADVFFPPRFKAQGGAGWPLSTPYLYPCTFLAHPSYWNEYTRSGPSQYEAIPLSWVTYPSSKTLIVSSWPFVDQSRARRTSIGILLPAAMCDGSVQSLSANERTNGYEKGDGYVFQQWGAVHYTDWPPLLHTIDGVFGRDAY